VRSAFLRFAPLRIAPLRSELEAAGVDLYLDQQSTDTTTPMGKLMFQVTGAFAEFERGMIRQRIHAGLKRAIETGKTLGRRRISAAVEKRIQDRAGNCFGVTPSISFLPSSHTMCSCRYRRFSV
jgi:DNA invertase Pin-like site-specific DNA recombinase